MDDLYDFLVQLKDLDLYNWYNDTECCKNGEWSGGFNPDGTTCECKNDNDDGQWQNLCIFTWCPSWTNFNDFIDWCFNELTVQRDSRSTGVIGTTKNFLADFMYVLFGSFTVVVATGEKYLPDRSAFFWPRFG